MAVYDSILDKVVDDIKAMTFTPNIPYPNIVRLKVSTDRPVDLPALPAVLVSPILRPSSPANEGTNMRDDITYPVLVLILKAGNQIQTADTFLDWQQAIRREFIHQHLGVDCVYTCFCDHRDTYNRPKWLDNLEVGAIIFRFVAREARA